MDLHDKICINYYTASNGRISAVVNEISSAERPIVIQQPTESIGREGTSQRRLSAFEQLRSSIEEVDISFTVVQRNPAASVTPPFETEPEHWTVRHYAILLVFSIICLLVLPVLLILSELNSVTGNPRFVEAQQSILRIVPYSDLFLENKNVQADRKRLQNTVEELEESSGRKPIAIIEHDADV